MEQSPCDENAACINSIGSFTCACNEGYSGDGQTCTGQYTSMLKEQTWVCVLIQCYASTPVKAAVVVKISCMFRYRRMPGGVAL